MTEIRAEEPVPSLHIFGHQSRLNQTLRLAMHRRDRRVNSLREIREREPLPGMEIQPGEKIRLRATTEDGQQRRSLSSHK